MVAEFSSRLSVTNQVQAIRMKMSPIRPNSDRTGRIRRNQLKYSNRFSPIRSLRHDHNKSGRSAPNTARNPLRTITNTHWQINDNRPDHRNDNRPDGRINDIYSSRQNNGIQASVNFNEVHPHENRRDMSRNRDRMSQNRDRMSQNRDRISPYRGRNGIPQNRKRIEVYSDENFPDFEILTLVDSFGRKKADGLFVTPTPTADYRHMPSRNGIQLQDRWSAPVNGISSNMLPTQHIDANNDEINVNDTDITLVSISQYDNTLMPNRAESMFDDSYADFAANVKASSTMILNDTIQKKKSSKRYQAKCPI